MPQEFNRFSVIVSWTRNTKSYQEAEIIRKIFDDYVNGATIKEIKTWLEESGIRTHKGNRFSFGRVSSMLRNQKYIGKCEYAGEVYDNIIMPIVDELTFNRAQELLVVNSHKSGRVRAGERKPYFAFCEIRLPFSQ